MYRAVVFDLDGVLWDGEPLYHEGFNVVLRRFGKVLTMGDYAQIIGSSTEAAWQWVLHRMDVDAPLDDIVREYDDVMMRLLEAPIEPLPGARDLIAALRSRGVPIGLATASFRNWADATLRGLGLDHEFQATVTASEVVQAKPAPDLYLQAAEGLGIDPKLCVAVEDSLHGVRAAKAAGMYAVQSRVASTALPPLDEANAVIESYEEFDLRLVEPFAGGK